MNELEIFVQARQHKESDQLNDYLQKATEGDESLLKRIERLLKLDLEANDIFDRDPQSILGELDPSTQSFASLSKSQLVEDVCASLDASDMADSLGRLLHYEVIELIGHGGFGFVLKAIDTKLRRNVAIKILHRKLSQSPGSRERFLAEARATASIRHDHNVQIYAVEEELTPFLVMEYIDGTTLQKHIQDNAPLPIEEVLRLGIEIVRGTEAAHDKNIVHRDIKPANILLERRTNRAKVTDFGLAITNPEQAVAGPTGLAGTPSFMSPEQARGECVDHLSDLFSIGSVLYLMCTGASPFRARRRHDVIKRVIQDEPEKIAKLNPAVPNSLIGVIERLHDKDPARRYQSAGEVADALEACVREHASSNRSVVFSKLAFVGIACFAAILAGVFYSNYQPKSAATAASKLDLASVANLDSKTLTTPSEKESASSGSQIEPPSDSLPNGQQQFDEFLSWMAKHNPNVPRSSVNHILRDGRIVGIECPATSSYLPFEKLPDLERITIYGTGVEQLDLSFAPYTQKISDLRINGFEIRSLEKLQGLPLKHLSMWGWRTPDHVRDGQLDPLATLPLEYLNCGCSMVRDLSPLEGMPLKGLCLNLTPVKSLEPLRGMPLELLQISHTSVSDLSPLADMQVKTLEIGSSPTTDIRPLIGTPIEVLRIDDANVEDLSVLKDMVDLKEVRIAHDEETASYLRKLLPQVTIRHDVPAPGYFSLNGTRLNGAMLFWAGASAKRDSLIERVLDRLLDLNPTMNFGECEFDIVDGKVVRFETYCANDLSPIAELTDLEDLQIHGDGSEMDFAFVSNLQNLHTLAIDNCRVKSLSAIKDLPLNTLYMWAWGRGEKNRDSDFAYLRGMPLKRINMGYSNVSDLSQLKGSKIEFLNVSYTQVKDLSPLRGMPINDLQMSGALVNDLSPLKGMPLEKLYIDQTGVQDPSPIKGMPIRDLRVPELTAKNRDIIASLPKLERVNDQPVESFLNKYSNLASKAENDQR